ncbi:MAG: hypothetical protein CL609_00950 [Anaerolineaceae bacterium]|nr:hypothetical protein [Anaerolineaceae bacterium]
MIYSDQNLAYLELLKTQQSAHKRNTRVIGVVSLFVFLLTLGTGMLRGLGSREVYLLAGLNVVLVLSFVMAWVRLEVVSQNISLITNLTLIANHK